MIRLHVAHHSLFVRLSTCPCACVYIDNRCVYIYIYIYVCVYADSLACLFSSHASIAIVRALTGAKTELSAQLGAVRRDGGGL